MLKDLCEVLFGMLMPQNRFIILPMHSSSSLDRLGKSSLLFSICQFEIRI